MNDFAHGIEARLAALGLLEEVLDRRQPLDAALEKDKKFTGLSARDRAFVRMIVATALRRLGQIDDFIRRASDKPHATISPPRLLHVLRLGVTQIAFMDVQDYAAVDTSVSLAEAAGLPRQKGLVNALLRRIAAEHRNWQAAQDPARLNTPDWLLQAWIADYGLRTAAEIALGNLSEAPLDISIKNPAMRAHWLETLGAALVPTGTLRRASGGMVQDLPGYGDGMWWVQDAAAAIPATLFGDVRGRHVIDLCAAPGGKTAQLAAMGAQVTAIDRSASRIKRLEENLARLRLTENVMTAMADSAVWRPKEPVHYVLLDAPCTATGTARRHPDVPHLKTPQDMKSLLETQARLLENAAAMLAPGGILIYCTCSLQKDEGERQVEKFLSGGARLRRLPVTPEETGGIEGILTPEGDIRILPFHLAAQGGMDGFFISRLQRI
jgi:16S rRNA (cytosine967-C5)-methyltransferase